ncbi:hypothetical protein F751_2694 [Auxenochlorella protothecoides]|uniref:Sphingomyelin phosphodiesterase 4 n=1 Tax=Auxenochlorella protothecoides TaxID=3075 RepID=A0A087SL72_AUXPR|nr:hypothetical protein F751_2694 [Auxenochlorella protothecoides]KFM26476.1 hypothetical protein F751_2694 [Auxenochlorella protothecoides]
MDRDWDPTNPQGLRAILERPRVNVAQACKAVEQCIAANRDNPREFFELCFPFLLKRLFGYDGVSWLSSLTKEGKAQDVDALLALLHPGGPLFGAMRDADADGATRFLFPRERLPTHTQLLLCSGAGRAELARWPQYGGGTLVADAAGRPSIHMGVAQYFFAWFAFYAFRGGEEAAAWPDSAPGQPGGGQASGAPHDRLLPGSMRRAVSDALHLPLLHGHGGQSAGGQGQQPYLALLSSLLEELVPVGGGVAGPSGRTPARRPELSRSPSLHAQRTQALLLLSTLPPSEELLGALGALARHVTVVPDAGGPRPAQQGAAWLPFVPLLTPAAAPAARTQAVLAGPSRLGPAASPGAQALARRLFRFHRRAASAWPEARSTRALARALGAILAPWRGASGAGDGQGLDVGPPGAGPPHGHHLADYLTTLRRGTGGRDAVRGRGAAAADHRRAPAADAAGRYSPEWEPHVLAHLPFYTVVLPLFLESAAARLEARGAGAARDVALLLGPLSSSPELCEVLRRAERAAAPSAGRAGAAGGRADAGPYADLAPWLADRAADWEAAAAASWHAPQPGTAPSAPSLFDPATAGGVSSAAAAALDLASAGDQVLPQEGAAALRACLATVFDLERAAGTGASGPAPDRTAGTGDGTRDGDPREVSNDGWQRLPRSSWRDVRYKGDPMLGPVASTEVAWLVRALVALSVASNRALGLDRTAGGGAGEAPETRWQEAVAAAAARGWRVNLRPLADVRNLGWTPVGVLVLYWVLWCLRALVGLMLGSGARGAAGAITSA